jgi:hypothetical protein
MPRLSNKIRRANDDTSRKKSAALPSHGVPKFDTTQPLTKTKPIGPSPTTP